ncbi:hypothetical protein HDU76_010498, partial [Blyttiomyces sp. JEL0837]
YSMGRLLIDWPDRNQNEIGCSHYRFSGVGVTDGFEPNVASGGTVEDGPMAVPELIMIV